MRIYNVLLIMMFAMLVFNIIKKIATMTRIRRKTIQIPAMKAMH
jgi:hypothetical protein